MNFNEDSPVTRFITHGETPWTSLARRSRYFDDVPLSQAPSQATTSVGSSPTAVFSSRQPSVITRPTSYGTDYPAHGYNKEGKEYAPSLSATHGSGSETEAEHNDPLGATLFGAGAWSSSHKAQGQLLRRHEHAKVRFSKSLPHRVKKPPVVLHQNTDIVSSAQPSKEQYVEAPLTSTMEEPRCLFHLVPLQHYIMIVMIGLMFLTVLLSAKHLHSVEKAEAASRKRTVLQVTTLVALEVLVTALCARRTLLEASLLGLFPLGIGSMVLLHLDDLSW